MIEIDEWSGRDRREPLCYAFARARSLAGELPVAGIPVWVPPGEESRWVEKRGRAVQPRYVASLFVTVDHDGYYEMPFSTYVDGSERASSCHSIDRQTMARFVFSPWLTLSPRSARDSAEGFLMGLRESLTHISQGCSVSYVDEVETSELEAEGIRLVVEMDLSLAGPEWDLPAVVADRLHRLIRLTTSISFLSTAKKVLGAGRAARRFSAEEVRSLHRGMPGEIVLPGCRNARGGASAVDGQ